MFERFRIGGAINYLLRLSAKRGAVSYKAVENALWPRISAHARTMKQQRLTADQAAVALITEAISEIEFTKLLMLQNGDRDSFQCLAHLFVICRSLRSSRPDEFSACFRDPPVPVANWLLRAAE